ncbi:hypothetical protein KKE78_00325 [Patescibacteria group bacterium]|nr:hypothetical protein [Patescibacteria group bacterium]
MTGLNSPDVAPVSPEVAGQGATAETVGTEESPYRPAVDAFLATVQNELKVADTSQLGEEARKVVKLVVERMEQPGRDGDYEAGLRQKVTDTAHGMAVNAAYNAGQLGDLVSRRQHTTNDST